MATIEQVDARINQIVTTVNKYTGEIDSLKTEYQQLLGYKQALVDSAPKNEESVSEETLLNE